MRRKNFIFLLLSLSALFLFAQPKLHAQDNGIQPLPRQFRDFSLGMNLDSLRESLTNDALFNFRGERDVSFLPVQQQSLVETGGSSFIRRAFFQLMDEGVFIMSFTLNTAIIDHFSVFTHFVQRYGEPTFLNPREAVWENGNTRISIERPLTVRYIDTDVFNDILNQAALNQGQQFQLRQEFLNDF
ncbi:MAG: hypothetical protein FWG66_03920 [Spirochaetes bacterium]|nr:hypothetical protein [Spirochaetota bacterium]